MVRYKVTLTSEERELLQSILGKGKHSSAFEQLYQTCRMDFKYC